MIRYEIKKIFSKSSGKVALAVLLFVLTITCYFAISDIKFVDLNGVTHEGILAARSLRAEKQKWEGVVTKEVLQAVIEENNYINESYPYTPESYTVENEIQYSKKQGFSDIRDMINQGFCDFREYNYYRVDTVTENEVYNLYENRKTNLYKWLYSDEAKEEFSEKERLFLLSQYEKLETPLYYEDADGWKAALNYSPTIIMLTVLVVAFLVSGIFSNEFKWRADDIFFSSKYGRDRGTRSKIAAGFIVVTAIYWIIVTLYSIIVLGCLGFDGGECKIQAGFSYWKSFYNITYLQLYLLTVVAGYVGTLFCLLLSMIVSAKTHTEIVAVTIPFAILFLPVFVSDFSFLKDVLGIFPDRMLQISTIVKYFDMYQVFGKVVGSIPIMLVIYSVLSVLLIPFIYWIYYNSYNSLKGKL